MGVSPYFSSPGPLCAAGALALLLFCVAYFAAFDPFPAASLAPGGALRIPLPAAPCHPVFVRYVPSALEEDWAAHLSSFPRSNVRERSFCGDVVGARFREPLQAWVRAAAAQNAAHPASRAEAEAAAAALRLNGVFSRFEYRDSCSGAASEARVAPLAGLLRDPRGPCTWGCCGPPEAATGDGAYLANPFEPNTEDIQTKDTVVVDPSHVAAVARGLAEARAAGRAPRAILLDAGASNYRQEGPKSGRVFAEWPGTRWLVERYRDLGVNFTDLFAWELEPKPGFAFFEGMPPDLVVATHFYNFGVSAEAGHPANPLTVLKAVARPGDFVVFKLDIDTGSIEAPIVEALLADDHARSLITDFYYELHYRGKDMHLFWRYSFTPDSPDLVGAAAIFRALREKGLKAQMWP
jgi:hypothetical protein